MIEFGDGKAQIMKLKGRLFRTGLNPPHQRGELYISRLEKLDNLELSHKYPVVEIGRIDQTGIAVDSREACDSKLLESIDYFARLGIGGGLNKLHYRD